MKLPKNLQPTHCPEISGEFSCGHKAKNLEVRFTEPKVDRLLQRAGSLKCPPNTGIHIDQPIYITGSNISLNATGWNILCLSLRLTCTQTKLHFLRTLLWLHQPGWKLCSTMVGRNRNKKEVSFWKQWHFHWVSLNPPVGNAQIHEGSKFATTDGPEKP